MTDDTREDGMRKDFRALRREVEESGAVPDFDAVMRRARAGAVEPTLQAHPGRAWWRPWVPLAAAAAVVGVLLVGRPGSDGDAQFERLVADYSTMVAGGAWRSPTASLMHVPGVDLGAVPSFGGYAGSARPDADDSEGRNR